MPIYEYKCEKCGRFEKLQKFSDEPLKECPTCGSSVQKIMSTSVGIVFKGSGFYSTDHEHMKNRARDLNRERQKDNEALLDGDVGSYVEQAESTTTKIAEA